MRQLGIRDSAFVNLEQPGTPRHVGGLGIYDPSTAPGGFVRFKSVIAGFERRLRRAPQFRARLVEVPGGLDRPYWIIDEQFDVEFHVRHIALPAPGDWRQLCIQVARLHSRPLDFSRPLWEAYIIEGLDQVPGLPNGSFAVYCKLHQSLFDGAGRQVFVDALHDLEPSPAAEEAAGGQERLYADEAPGDMQMLVRAALNQLANGAETAQGLMRAGGELARRLLQRVRDNAGPPAASAPPTRFNGQVGPHRVFEAATFSLADLRRLGDATGARLNAIGLTVIGGAIQRYLAAHGELPELSLSAALPLERRGRDGGSTDNDITGVSLHTDVDEPLQRLQRVQDGIDAARERDGQPPFADTLALAGILPPWLFRTVASLPAARLLKLPLAASTMVASAAAPAAELYCAGARLLRYHGLGPLAPGAGLCHTLFRCADTLTISVVADREQMPDPAFYRGCLEESFAELRDAVDASARTATSAAGRRRSAPKQAASGHRAAR